MGLPPPALLPSPSFAEHDDDDDDDEERPGIGGSESCTIRNSAAIGGRCAYGGEPVTSSTASAPAAHTSRAGAAPAVASTASGDIQ